MTKCLIIWGAGGHGKVVLDAAKAMQCFESIIVVDDDVAKLDGHMAGVRIGKADELHRWAGGKFAIAIGDNGVRSRCFFRARQLGLTAATIVHPSAAISDSAVIGAGTVILPGAIVNACATIGSNCIVNTGAIIEHDCSIGDHVHIAPRVVIGGAARVGRLSLVGLGAVLLPGCLIGEHATVGAGSVVLKEVPAHATAIGVPSKVIVHA